MTTLDHVTATHQSEWVSFNEEPPYLVSSDGATEEHLAGLSESSSGENPLVDGGSRDLSPSEQDDPSEKIALVPAAAPAPGSPEQPTPDLASAISNWVQFEDDTPWTSTSAPHKETAPPLTMPCWTCPSFDALGRCPLASESSWTTHSEDTSSPSLGPSYTDLQIANAEDQMSGRASGSDSTGKLKHQTKDFANHLSHVSPVVKNSTASSLSRMSSSIAIQSKARLHSGSKSHQKKCVERDR